MVDAGLVSRSQLRAILKCEIAAFQGRKPSIETVLRVSTISKVAPVDLLTGKLNVDDGHVSPSPPRVSMLVHTQVNYDNVCAKLEINSKDHPDLSVSELCRQLGISRLNFFRNRPKEATRIRKRYMQHRQKLRVSERERIVEVIDKLIARGRYISWNALKNELPGIYTDADYMETVNALLEQRGFIRNSRGYLVAKM
jgi:hypothetical protein